MKDRFSVTWVFRNEFEWHKRFRTADDRDVFVLTTGILTHPDITRIAFHDGDVEKHIKQAG